MSTINRIGSNQSLLGTSSADFITGIGSNLTVDAGAGNDTINVTGSNAKIYAGVGNDVISATGSNVVVDGGEGNDTLTSAGGNVSLSGGAGNDVLTANAGEVNVEGVTTTTLNGGAGSNTLTGSKYNEIFQYGNGNYVVFSYGEEDTVHVASGTISSIYASGGDVILKIGSNTMTIKDAASKYVTIKDSSGSVTTKKYGGESSGGKNITNYTANTLISGTSYNDTIYTAADKVTVRAGEGNDSINNSRIRGSADSVVVDGGAGGDIIINTGKKSTLLGGDGSDYIYNYKTISDGNGNAVYDSVGTGVVIKAGDDNDYVYNGGPTSVSIDGGAGNDTVMVWYGGHNAIDGGAGSDIISLATGTHYDSANTIAGGADNDSVYFDSASTLGNVYVYNSGDGSDVIYNASSKDTVSISGATYTPSTIGTSLVLSITGGGAITLNGASTNSPVIIIDDIYLTTGDDSVDINDSGVKVYALAGNDSIHVYGANDTIYGEAGKDYIWNFGVGAYIYGNEGDDTFDNRANNAKVYGGAGNDYFHNDPLSGGGENTSLYGEAGNDTMNNFVSNVTMIGGAGNDSLRNNRICFSGSKTLYGGENVYMDGGEGDDYIYSDGRPAGGGKVTIRGGAGNDTIALANDSRNNLILFSPNEGSDVITGLDADDTISLSGYYTRETVGTSTSVVVSLQSGGSMTLTDASSKTINIIGGSLIPSGGLVINNTVNGAVVNGSAGNDTINNSGNSAKIYAGAGNDSIYNGEVNYASVSGGDGDDTITNINFNYNSLSGDNGNDVILNSAVGVTMNGGAGNDKLVVENPYAYIVTVLGGEGNDSITVYGGLAEGGAGNDIVSVGSYYYSSSFPFAGLTVKGGTGDDTVYGNSTLGTFYEFGKSDGNDVIYNIGDKDTISLAGVTSSGYSTLASGSNVVVNISGGGTVTFAGAKGKSFTLYPAKVPDPVDTVSPQDVIKIMSAVLDTVTSSGIAAVNRAVSIASGGYFPSAQEVINQMVTDRNRSASSTAFLKNYCAINLSNDDTGAIIGSDAGGTKKTAEDIIPESGSLNTSFKGNSFSTNGATFTLSKWTDFNSSTYKAINFSDLATDDQRYIWQSLYTWWGESALDVIEESFGYRFDEAGTSVKNIAFTFVNDPNDVSTRANNDFLGLTTYWSSNAKATQLVLTFNMAYYYGFNSSTDKDGKSPLGQIYLDRVIAHELTHAIMAANVDYYAALPTYIKEGYCEVIHGGDYRSADMLTLADNTDKLRQALNPSANYAQVDGVFAPSYAGGIMFMRYFAEQAAEHYGENVNTDNIPGLPNTILDTWYSINGSAFNVTGDFDIKMIDLANYSASLTKVDASILTSDVMIIGNERANTLISGSGADTISGNVGNDNLQGGAGNDQLYGDAGNDKLYGGAGNDTLEGGAGNNTLEGGAGNDIFVFYNGNDVITDYEAGKDKIQLAYYNLAGASLKGSDVVLQVGAGNVTVKGAANKKITIIDALGSETSQVYPTVPSHEGITVKGATLTAGPTFTGNKIDLAESYASGATKVNASALSRGVSIIGTAAANSLKGGKGADTISGGSGNDTVSLGAGADVYIYSSGNDFIQDYVAGTDKIQLASATITGSSLSGSNVVLKTSGGNITVKSAKDNAITVIDAAGKETSQVYPTVPSYEGISVKNSILTASISFTGNKIDLAESYASGATKVNATVLSAGVSILGSAAANSVKGGKGSDTISGLAGNDTNYGGAGNDVIYGGAGNDKLYGDAGNDTLYGNAGNDTLTGGAGSDVFVYEAGNDVIADYVAGTDKIKLASASITGSSLSSSNVVLKTSSGNITVKSGKGKQLTIIDAAGKETSQVYPSTLNYDANRTSVTLASSFSGTLKAADYDSTVKKIDASAVTRAININGNAQANTILGSAKVDTIYGAAGNDSISGAAGNDKLFGDAGNDTLCGGAGNDTLTGGAGSDTFVYGASEGKDVIEDYTAGQDKIKISSGTISKTAYSGQNVVFTVGSGTLTVKNARGKSISIVDASGKTSTKTYTTGVSYGSNGNAEVPWFAEDDTNFVSGETQLDEISAENYSVTNFSVTNLENFAQLETPSLAAYSEK